VAFKNFFEAKKVKNAESKRAAQYPRKKRKGRCKFSFRRHFSENSDEFVVIGGVAAHVIMASSRPHRTHAALSWPPSAADPELADGPGLVHIRCGLSLDDNLVDLCGGIGGRQTHRLTR
jgi:hypothetical protein